MVAIAFAGLTAGMVHVLAGPDHLAAVAPLAADSRRPGWRAGCSWGLGHTGGVLAVGVLALLLRGLLPVDALSSWSERLVGVALIAVGIWGLRRAASIAVHSHAHAHDGHTHAHLHAHLAGGRAHAHEGAHAHHVHASFGVGVLHGLAGSSHVLGILPALALPTTAASVAYLLAYGVGTVAAMTSFSSAVGILARRARTQGPSLHRGLLCTCSSAAILVGGFWLMA